ncbi:hypothetical protein KUTeg_018974 [Tegillarca granosa]|uniref:HYR domain-containing protein n=1 Tax=Tegillarca granosa TaxID=220873 RepID=A0ABQ9EH47_TEGGR|nr:hypothetical protein KUTeg_018974 [Tegillarca granosa]
MGVCTDSQNPCTRGSICTTKPTQNTATCLCQSNKLNYLDTDRKTCKTPKNNYMLIADVDGLKMASLESDSHVYTIRPGSGKCGPFKGLALDPYGKKIYYTESESGKIYRANIDGTNEEQLLEHEHRIEHITFSNDQLFWTSLYGCNDTMGGIYQWNLNPQSTPIELKMNVSQPHGIAANARYICWSDKAGINAYELTKKKFYMNLMPSGTSVRSLSLDDLGTLYISYSNGSLIARKFPNEPFRPALSINEGNLMPGEGMFVSGKYCYMVTSRNQIKLFDRLTKLSRTKNLNMGSLANPGQIVVIQDSSDLSSEQQDLIKPGVCSTSVTRNCASYDCNNDLVCGGNQKCCYNTGSCGASACEDPEISGDICQLNINGTRINWSEKQGKYSDGCIECDCTNPNCQLMCPQLTCSEADQVNGGCCQVCSSIKKCSEKPEISNCPTIKKTIELPADKSYVLLDHQNLKIESISAMSCDFQPVKLSPLMPNNVTWKQDPQKIRITATDKQGTDICEFQLKVNDNISPLITYCPSNINGIAKSNEGLKVEWLEPRATDNSGEVKIEYDPDSRKNGENFPVGLDILKYLVRDGAGNVNESCQFTVNITKKEISCHEPPVLQNGILRCSSSGGKTSCHIEKCNDGYVKFPDHDKIYECSTDRVWKPAFPELFKLEACFKPEPVEIKLPFFVTMIDCPIINFNKYYLLNCLSISNLCPAPGSKISLCKEDRITVTHSANTETTSVIGNTMGELPFGGDLNTVINDIHQANLRVVYFFSNKTYEILCPKLACDIDINKTRSALTSEAKESCPVGSEYHKDVNGKPACIKCSPGKYYKGTRCAKCLKGTYQEDPGQILCLECKTGTTTIKEAAYREAHCIKITEDPRGTDIGLILGLVITALLVIVIALGVVFLIKRRRQREAIKKGQYESSSDVKDKRVSDVYDELKEDEYNVIPADHVPSNPDDAGNDGYASPKDMPSVGNDGYASPKDMPGVGNDGYATPKDMPNTGNDGYVMSKDAQKNRALPNPYAQLGSKKDGDKDYEGLLTSPYEKLQASKEKEETYTNPVYIGNIN